MITNQNILVTGAAGFIGSFVCQRLVHGTENCKVIGFDILSYCASLDNLIAVRDDPCFSFVRGDIRSQTEVESVMVKHNIDMIVHCAAESHVDNSFGNSLHFTEVNVYGTHVLLECARKRFDQGKFRRFLHVSTDEVYGTTEEGTVQSESDVLCPTNPYAASKAAAEQFVRSYAKSFGLPIVITRSNNIYGPRQHPEKVLPRFIQRCLRGNLPVVNGDLQNERTFLYVTDVADAICIVLERGSAGETYNIGSENQIKIHELAKMVVDMCNARFGTSFDKHFQRGEHDRPFNDPRYRLSWEPIKKLGWSPQMPFEQGVRMTIDWHVADKEHLRKYYWNDTQWLALVQK